MADEKDEQWTPNRDVTHAAMDDLEAMFAAWPACRLCGQRTRQLDKFGLCSKTSEAHKDWRAGARAEMKAGTR